MSMLYVGSLILRSRMIIRRPFLLDKLYSWETWRIPWQKCNFNKGTKDENISPKDFVKKTLIKI